MYLLFNSHCNDFLFYYDLICENLNFYIVPFFQYKSSYCKKHVVIEIWKRGRQRLTFFNLLRSSYAYDSCDIVFLFRSNNKA